MHNYIQEVHKHALKPRNYFQSIPTYVIIVCEHYRQTDRHTDRQTNDLLWHNRTLHSMRGKHLAEKPSVT